MTSRLFLGVSSLVVLMVPGAAAQGLTITLERGDGHPADHVPVIDDTRRHAIPIAVKGTAQGFVCPQAVRVDVEVLLLPYPDEWAGASMNPATASFDIPAGGPGVDAQQYEGQGDVMLELYWAEERPPTGARQTYTIESDTSWEPLCLPAPPEPTEGRLEVTAEMEDAPAPDGNNTTAPLGGECAEAPDLPECQPLSVSPEADSPGMAGIVAAAVAGGAALALRRGRAQ